MEKILIKYIEQQSEIYGSDLPIEYKELVDSITSLIPRIPDEKQIDASSPLHEKKNRKDIAKQGTNNILSSIDNKNESAQINSMEELRENVKNCKNCELASCRNKFVFGKGNPEADILIIGEAPGADEDLQGLPFVGKAGQLLDKVIVSIDLNLSKVYITNIVKCRPPGNRDPKPEEILSCHSMLHKQIELMKPKLILAVGRVSARSLLNSDLSLSKLRGKFHSYGDIEVLVTYHPSALLRNPSWKRPTWEDMKIFRKRYDDLIKFS